jgi:putative effector of murein hydrolase
MVSGRRGWQMNQKVILIFEIILCIFVQVIIYLISHFLYADVLNIKFFIVLLSNWIIITIINWKKEINTERPKPRWFTYLLISIVIVVFIAYKPGFSYEKGNCCRTRI